MVCRCGHEYDVHRGLGDECFEHHCGCRSYREAVPSDFFKKKEGGEE